MAIDIGALQFGNIDLGALQSLGGPETLTGSTGIPSEESFGLGSVLNTGDQAIIGSSGIASLEAFGAGAVGLAGDLVGGSGIASEESFGHGLLTFSNFIQGQYGIASEESFGHGALITKAFTVFVGGVDRTARMRVNSLDITNQISQVSTCTFLYGGQDRTSPLIQLPVGTPVIIYHGNTRIFGGTVDQAVDSFYGPTSTEGPNYFNVTCSDCSSILDRRIVGAFYPSGSVFDLQTIVHDIIDQYLSEDNITYDDSDGHNTTVNNLGDLTFDWITARQAFAQLANLVQWDFNVDYFGVLRFYPNTQGSGVAPFNIADNDGNWLQEPAMTVQEYRGTYRNNQGVRSSSQTTALWSDVFSTASPGPFPNSPQPPDGTRISFITRYGIPTTPSVFVNSVQQRVVSLLEIGTAGPDGYDWYWIPPQGFPPAAGVFQNQANPPLGSTDVLVVNYQSGLSPILFVKCQNQINIRKAIEGNSGVYDDVQDAPNITDPQALQTYALGLLNRYGCLFGMPKQVVYTTDSNGLFAGMTQIINTTNPSNPTVTPYMISQVQIRDIDGKFLRYTVTADSGLWQTSSSAYLGAIVNRGQLPQPANRQTYSWQLAPSYPGVTNPGLLSGALQTQATLFGSEVPLYMTLWCGTPPADVGHNVSMEINTSIFGGTFPIPTENGPNTFYFGQAEPFQQNSKLTPLFQGGDSGIKDGVLTLVTAVIRN